MDTPSQEPSVDAGAALRQLYGLPADATEEVLKEAQRVGRTQELDKLGLTTDATEAEVLAALERDKSRMATLEVLRKAEAEQTTEE